jgi:uncharacterized membrane protein YfhO
MSFFIAEDGGGLIALVGGFFYITFMFVFLCFCNDWDSSWAFMIPIAVLSFGLLMLSAFVSFRTERRHKVLGIWRAD